MLVDEMLPLKAKDPYEFNDEFDEDSPSSSFRARLDVSFFSIQDLNDDVIIVSNFFNMSFV